jgi:hypothetical protein
VEVGRQVGRTWTGGPAVLGQVPASAGRWRAPIRPAAAGTPPTFSVRPAGLLRLGSVQQATLRWGQVFLMPTSPTVPAAGLVLCSTVLARTPRGGGGLWRNPRFGAGGLPAEKRVAFRAVLGIQTHFDAQARSVRRSGLCLWRPGIRLLRQRMRLKPPSGRPRSALESRPTWPDPDPPIRPGADRVLPGHVGPITAARSAPVRSSG